MIHPLWNMDASAEPLPRSLSQIIQDNTASRTTFEIDPANDALNDSSSFNNAPHAHATPSSTNSMSRDPSSFPGTSLPLINMGANAYGASSKQFVPAAPQYPSSSWPLAEFPQSQDFSFLPSNSFQSSYHNNSGLAPFADVKTSLPPCQPTKAGPHHNAVPHHSAVAMSATPSDTVQRIERIRAKIKREFTPEAVDNIGENMEEDHSNESSSDGDEGDTADAELNTVQLNNGDVVHVPVSVLEGSLRGFRAYCQKLKVVSDEERRFSKLRRRFQTRVASRKRRRREKRALGLVGDSAAQQLAKRNMMERIAERARSCFPTAPQSTLAAFIASVEECLAEYALTLAVLNSSPRSSPRSSQEPAARQVEGTEYNEDVVVVGGPAGGVGETERPVRSGVASALQLQRNFASLATIPAFAGK